MKKEAAELVKAVKKDLAIAEAKAEAKRKTKDKAREKKNLDKAKAARRADVERTFRGDAKKKSKSGRAKDTSSNSASSDDSSSNNSDDEKKKRRKTVKYADDSTTSNSESDSPSDDSDDNRRKGKRSKRDESLGSDAPARKRRGSGGKKKWRRELGSANSKHTRYETIQFKNWKKKNGHRTEAQIVFDKDGRSFGVFEHRAFKAVGNINTLAVAHPVLRAMVVVLQNTYGPTMDRLSEVLGDMTECGPFPRSAELNVATDGPILCMLVSIHRCEVQTVHTKTVNQIFHTMNSPSSEWLSKITDIDSYAVETPVTKTAHGYTGSAYTAKAGTVSHPFTPNQRGRAASDGVARGGFPHRGGLGSQGRGNGVVPVVPVVVPVAAPPNARGGLAARNPNTGCNNCGALDGHWGRNCVQICTLPPCVAAVAGVKADVKHTGATCPFRK